MNKVFGILCAAFLFGFVVTPCAGDEWQEIKPVTKPPARSGHSLVSLNGALYVFGGDGASSGQGATRGGALLNDLWRFDVEQMKWEEMIPQNVPPMERHSHAATVANGKMFVLFGTGSGTVFSDIWSYDPVPNTWKQEPSTGTTPGPRYLHTATLLDNGLIAVFGGLSAGGATTDAYVYAWDPATGQWLRKNTIPGGSLYGHSTVGIGDSLYIFGGYGATGYTNQVVLFDFRENHGVKLPIEDPLPSPRAFQSAARQDNRVWIFGGEGAETPLGDTWEFNKDDPSWNQRTDMSFPLSQAAAQSLLFLDDSKHSLSGIQGPGEGPGANQERGATLAVLLFGGMNQAVPVDRTFLYYPNGAPPPTGLYVSKDGKCGGLTPCYDEIQDALNDAGGGALIKVSGEDYNEAPVKNTAGTVTISGAWNSSFTAQTGKTTLHAPAAPQGALILQEVVLTP